MLEYLAVTLNVFLCVFKVYLLTKPVEVLVDLICDPDKLTKILVLPEISPINVTDLSILLCEENSTNTMTVIKDIALNGENITSVSFLFLYIFIIEGFMIDILILYKDIKFVMIDE